MTKNKPEVVIIAAAKVGGIKANDNYRADFLYQNLQIQNNLIHGSYLSGVKKLIFFGSSCIYPKFCKQPIKETYLLTAPLEYTNEPYAIAKIAGIKLIENYNKQYGLNYISLMPCNLYGPNDNYDTENSHFFPALIKKIHEAKINKSKYITLWGDGSAKRELMYVDDLSEACLFFLNHSKISHSLINIGSGIEKTIKDFAIKVMQILDYKCEIKFNKKMPNGTPRKVLDLNLCRLYGWKHQMSLVDGIKFTYNDFLNNTK